MASDIEYALMAGRVYQSTRGTINWFSDLQSLGWTERLLHQESSGFEAISFQKGTEIVISFAGTGSGVDWWANGGGFFGVTSEQLRQAADYYLQVRTATGKHMQQKATHELIWLQHHGLVARLALGTASWPASRRHRRANTPRP